MEVYVVELQEADNNYCYYKCFVCKTKEKALDIAYLLAKKNIGLTINNVKIKSVDFAENGYYNFSKYVVIDTNKKTLDLDNDVIFETEFEG